MSNIDNMNQLDSTQYKLVFSRIPELTFFANRVSLPGVTIGLAQQPNMFKEIPLPGQSITYDPLVVQFIIDEDLKNWEGIASWMRTIVNADNFTDYALLKQLDKGVYSDITLHILTNNSVANRKFKYYDVFPISLVQVEMETSSQEPAIMCTATFAYSYYELE